MLCISEYPMELDHGSGCNLILVLGMFVWWHEPMNVPYFLSLYYGYSFISVFQHKSLFFLNSKFTQLTKCCPVKRNYLATLYTKWLVRCLSQVWIARLFYVIELFSFLSILIFVYSKTYFVNWLTLKQQWFHDSAFLTNIT